MTLKVALNLLWLVPGVVGGSEEYAVGLLEALATRDDIETTAFGLPGFVEQYPSLAAAVHTTAAPLPSGRHVVRRVAVENAWLPRQLRSREVDLVHHLGGVVPPACRVPAVVTLHDLQYLAYPEYFSATKRRYLHAVQGPSLRRARAVIAISDFTRTQAIDAFNLDADSVTVIPPTVRTLPAVPAARVSVLLAGMGVHGSFILYPAAPYPHKNHVVLLNAFAQLAKDHDVTLVLTGAVGAGAWGSAHSTQATIDSTAAALGVQSRVRQLGYVTTEQLAALYLTASALAFPSRFEGFGIPIVEAMASGCPVVAANASALPAVVGDAGVVVDPDDVEAWASALGHVLDDRAHRDALVAAGRARAAGLANIDRAQQLVDVYHRAVA